MGFGLISQWSFSLIIDPIGPGLSEAGDNEHEEGSLVAALC